MFETTYDRAERLTYSIANAFHRVADRRPPIPRIRAAMINRAREHFRWAWREFSLPDETIEGLLRDFEIITPDRA